MQSNKLWINIIYFDHNFKEVLYHQTYKKKHCFHFSFLKVNNRQTHYKTNGAINH